MGSPSHFGKAGQNRISALTHPAGHSPLRGMVAACRAEVESRRGAVLRALVAEVTASNLEQTWPYVLAEDRARFPRLSDCNYAEFLSLMIP